MGTTLGIGITFLDNYNKLKKYLKQKEKLENKLDTLYKNILKINKEKTEKIIKENNFKKIIEPNDFINLKIRFSIYDKPELNDKEYKIIDKTNIDKLDEFLKLYNEIEKIEKKIEFVSIHDYIIDASYNVIGWLGDKIKEIKNIKNLEDGVILSPSDIDILIKETKDIKKWDDDEIDDYLKEEIIKKLNRIKHYLDDENICIAKTF